MIDAGTVTEADELDAREPTENAVVDGTTEGLAWDDAAVLDRGVIVGASVEADELDFTVEPTEGVDIGIDVWVEAEGTRLGVEVGVVEDAVVDGGTGAAVLEVEDTEVEVGVVEAVVLDGGTGAAVLEAEEMAASVVVGIT